MNYNLLTAPLTMGEIRTLAAADEHNFITGVVAVDLAGFINNDFEGVLDLLSEALTDGPLLMDFTYAVVGFKDNTLHIELTGDASMIIEDDDIDDNDTQRLAADKLARVDELNDDAS